MKYLKKYNESRGETLIDKIIVYLNDITHDLRDSGYDVDIFNGSNIGFYFNKGFGGGGPCPVYLMDDVNGKSYDGVSNNSKYIYIVISSSDKDVTCTNHKIVKDLVDRLIRDKIGYRSISGILGENRWDKSSIDNVAIIRIDKKSRLSRSEIEDLIS